MEGIEMGTGTLPSRIIQQYLFQENMMFLVPSSQTAETIIIKNEVQSLFLFSGHTPLSFWSLATF